MRFSEWVSACGVSAVEKELLRARAASAACERYGSACVMHTRLALPCPACHRCRSRCGLHPELRAGGHATGALSKRLWCRVIHGSLRYAAARGKSPVQMVATAPHNIPFHDVLRKPHQALTAGNTLMQGPALVREMLSTCGTGVDVAGVLGHGMTGGAARLTMGKRRSSTYGRGGP